MRLLMLIALLTAALPSAGRAQEGNTSADEAALRELKEVLWPRAYREQDTTLLDRILAPEFRRIDGEGAWWSKADEMARVSASRPTYDTLIFDIRRLQILGGTTAIVAGTGTVRGSDARGPYVAEYQSTNVLVKREGAWRAVASHVSGYKRK